MGYILKKKINLKYFVSRNYIQFHTGHTIICKRGSNFENQEVLHGPSVRGCMFMCLINNKRRLKYRPKYAKEIHKQRGCPI